MQERTLPSSASPLYSAHSKTSVFGKGGIGQPSSRKQLVGGLFKGLAAMDIFLLGQLKPQGSGASGYLKGYTPVNSLAKICSSPVHQVLVSKAVLSMRKDSWNPSKEECPLVLSVTLVDYSGGNNTTQENLGKGAVKQLGRDLSSDAKEF
ncbi:Mediator of RNA polymerase II transcription subunit 13 [Abeliophyllum distichum]|uniref:Mediator of RNA polymerase II transcription subunit 13 n=1 Tax=Abeliophyllum distichum TaxID=126358 RepID=A0ABD1P8H4_9LAMI